MGFFRDAFITHYVCFPSSKSIQFALLNISVPIWRRKQQCGVQLFSKLALYFSDIEINFMFSNVVNIFFYNKLSHLEAHTATITTLLGYDFQSNQKIHNIRA